ncbi:MAG: hypothetical protein DRG78_04040 [Epsilonproteobacteria bacterium]|nr:MAG: hypothetical protein DRG78_04040 [Campylobacterota bacterium]
MSKQGFLIIFDESRRNDLIKMYASNKIHIFSEALSINDWKIKEYDIAFLSFNMKTIDYISLVRKGSRVVTSKNKIEFIDILDVNSISIESINKKMDKRIQKYFISSSQGHGDRLTQKTFQDLIEIIKKSRPSIKNKINILLNKRNLVDRQFNNQDKTKIFMQEKDALGTALDIFSGSNNLRKEVLQSWNTDDRNTLKDNSFFDGLKKEYLSEEDTLQHDLFNWPGMVAEHISQKTTFRSGSNRLDVIYANRNALEKTVGVDLIYYNEKYNSFILIQYKLMSKEKGSSFIYRPDKQLDDEIKRMNTFNTKIASCNTIKNHKDMRLSNNGFMLKLTPDRGFKPMGDELIAGMYLTLDYSNYLFGKDGPKGKNGGRLITYDNSPRYLNNSDFIKLLNKGWIGTNNIQSERIKELIKEFYETKRAVIFAHDYGL